MHLAGKGVQIVTVNDYLAKRDAEWMGQVHEFLGLTGWCGIKLHDLRGEKSRYTSATSLMLQTTSSASITFVTIWRSIKSRWCCVISTTVSSMRSTPYLIDEARTPLIISGQSGKSTKLYEVCDVLAKQLVRGEDSGEFNKIECDHGRGDRGDR